MVSVIIPTLNEEEYLTDCLNSLRHTECELIVVDGGSADHTVALAESLDAKVIASDIANRGKQMNLGAAAAQGELLLFFQCRQPAGGGRDGRGNPHPGRAVLPADQYGI